MFVLLLVVIAVVTKGSGFSFGAMITGTGMGIGLGKKNCAEVVVGKRRVGRRANTTSDEHGRRYDTFPM